MRRDQSKIDSSQARADTDAGRDDDTPNKWRRGPSPPRRAARPALAGDDDTADNGTGYQPVDARPSPGEGQAGTT